MVTINKRAYAEMFGPTVGDRVRLADTDLIIEVETDYTLHAGSYGEEVQVWRRQDHTRRHGAKPAHPRRLRHRPRGAWRNGLRS